MQALSLCCALDNQRNLARFTKVYELEHYRRFSRWCDAGVFEALHEHFHDAGAISGILLDSTIVRAHASAAGAPKKKADKRHRHSDELEADLRRN